jgi:hypothetical protein
MVAYSMRDRRQSQYNTGFVGRRVPDPRLSRALPNSNVPGTFRFFGN